MAGKGKLLSVLWRGRNRAAPAPPVQPPTSPTAAAPAPPAAPDPEPRVRLELAAELRSARAESTPAPPSGADALRAQLESESPADRARRRYQRHIDDAVAEAEARGDFANLRLKGQPIPAELLVGQDEAWLANRAVANAGFVPPWLQLRQEIDADLADCQRLVERVERYPPRVNRELPLRGLEQRLEAIRAKARRYNLMVPTMALQRPLPDTAPLLQRMRAAVEAT